VSAGTEWDTFYNPITLPPCSTLTPLFPDRFFELLNGDYHFVLDLLLATVE